MANIPIVIDTATGLEVARDFSVNPIETYTVNADFIEVEVDEDIATWRISYDVENEAIVVKYDGMSNDGA